VESDSAKIEELSAIIQTVRDRVRARYPEPDGRNGNAAADSGSGQSSIRIPLADLTPVVHARDAAQAKIAAIGSVNPRAGGLVNRAIQAVKKTIARALQWFVRDQIAFNRETVAAIEAVIEALNDHNRALVSLAAHANEQSNRVTEQSNRLAEETRELKDMRSHWPELRADWDSKVAANEIQFLRSVADLQATFQYRSTLMESNFREIVQAQHADYLGALDRANLDIQKRLWRDMEQIRQEYERLIHNELRVVRQRIRGFANSADHGLVELPTGEPSYGFDYGRFAERFRGTEEYVRRNIEFYKPYFAECENVLDIGCGRGEFLSLMREQGVAARGIDLSAECVAQCRQNGLNAEAVDLFSYLDRAEQEFDGIFSSQVVEHLDPRRLPEMIGLCAAKLRRGGLLAIETPNPECLAIFATHFYLDPTHTRPIPHPLMVFYMEEAGFGLIEVHDLSQAVDSMPELAELPEAFRKRFFGGLDYAIVGRKL
jgi:2-polyprenyl-3-methyl-5-hydroxy-6-metoxy-1,4-benzoquinol methylase